MPTMRDNATRVKRFRELKTTLRTNRQRLLVGLDIAQAEHLVHVRHAHTRVVTPALTRTVNGTLPLLPLYAILAPLCRVAHASMRRGPCTMSWCAGLNADRSSATSECGTLPRMTSYRDGVKRDG